MTGGTHYIYGMRNRGFSIGCQPMNGLVKRQDDWFKGRYHDLLVYDRRLTADEMEAYELDFVTESKPIVLDNAVG